MATKVELFYDVLSPYSWFAFETLCRYRGPWNLDLYFRPFFLGGLMNLAGNKPPMTVPNKAQYMQHDLQRGAEYFKVPLRNISDPVKTLFEKGSLPAMRFVTAVAKEKPTFVEEVSRQFWWRLWHHDEDITEAESFKEVGERAGLSKEDIQQCLEMLKTTAVKEKLKKETEYAYEKGAFGSPYIIAHANGEEHCFFGSDRFPILAMVLKKKWIGPDPLSPSELDGSMTSKL
ncbi:unnamed protein product [Darwinula stevensoni]|uniref:Glutathione S-transferase kappa n=1 Tax=Darwinula stevensoni TaxID=69355 RepID=A0A7R8X5V2_9CRUS|nr:unnamed protein product [Darwinula stevensoni]CAG0880512.1 unnamed protein product [Darwinula stevensoni]